MRVTLLYRGVPLAGTVVVTKRHPLRWVATALVAVLAALFVKGFVTSPYIHIGVVGQYLFAPIILGGVLNTLLITVLAQGTGIVIGVVLALFRQSANPLLRSSASFYVWFFRGIPVLVQLFFWYNLPGVFKVLRLTVPGIHLTLVDVHTLTLLTPFTAALLGLGLNEGAYMAEIVRAGILSVGPGQMEAALSLGMTRAEALRRVVLPQAVRVVVPPTGNELVSMLKTSALASTILYSELLRRASEVYTANLDVVALLLVAAIWYLVLTSIANLGQAQLERRLGRAERIGRRGGHRRVPSPVATVEGAGAGAGSVG